MPLTIQIELPAAVEAGFAARARAEGVSLGEYVHRFLVEHAPRVEPHAPSPEEFDRIIDEITAMIPTDRPPLSEKALSRESWYDDEAGI